MDAIQDKRWMSRPNGAAYAGLSLRLVDALIAEGKLKPSRPSKRRVLLDREDLDRYLEASK